MFRMGEMSHFGTQNQHFTISLNLCIRHFRNYTWWQAWKSGEKWLFWFLKENHMMPKVGVNGSSVRTVDTCVTSFFFVFFFSKCWLYFIVNRSQNWRDRRVWYQSREFVVFKLYIPFRVTRLTYVQAFNLWQGLLRSGV